MAPRKKVKTSPKPMIIMVASLVLVFGGLFGWMGLRGYFMGKFMAGFQPPPVTIQTTHAKTTQFQSHIDVVGTLSAVRGVEIKNEVPGVIKAINFSSGQIVKQGSLLVTLDSRIEQADLKNYQAQLKLAKISYDRIKKLYVQKSIAQSALDTQLAKLQETQALVERTQAIIAQKNIKAPFTGKLGIKHIDLGSFIPAGTQLVSLQTLDPLYVEFNLPEQDFPKLMPHQSIEIVPENGSHQLYSGEITAVDAKVDKDTRSIQVQGTLPNIHHGLLPGMSAMVKVIDPKKHSVITLPQTAIDYSLYGDSVFIVKEEEDKNTHEKVLKAYRQFVKVGEREHDIVNIIEGVHKGDQVVTAGQLKLHNGSTVKVKS